MKGGLTLVSSSGEAGVPTIRGNLPRPLVWVALEVTSMVPGLAT